MTDPLHGVTLKTLLQELVDRHGWDVLGQLIPIRCFLRDPSLTSSLRFLRKTPWARGKVEALYIRHLNQIERKRARNQRRAERRAFASLPVERSETLALTWPGGAPGPDYEVPPGFTLEVGVDREGFAAVQQAIGFEITDPIWARLDLVPGGMAVAHDEEGASAVACAERRGEDWVEIGWVAVAPAKRGRGLGRAVCAALIARLLEDGHRHIVGSTQDERIHALGIYLGLGFRPVERPEKRERWAAVLAILA